MLKDVLDATDPTVIHWVAQFPGTALCGAKTQPMPWDTRQRRLTICPECARINAETSKPA